MMSFDISGTWKISWVGFAIFFVWMLSDLAVRYLGELFRRICSSVFHQDNSDRFLFLGAWNVSLSISDDSADCSKESEIKTFESVSQNKKNIFCL